MTPLAFELRPLSLSLDKILLSRQQPAGLAMSRKFRQIVSSIAEIGLIEPLSVAPVNGKSEQHLLLDGHMRLAALRELGHSEVPCLVAKDDEGYTYNNRVNRLSTIQEHFMIRRAIERGV